MKVIINLKIANQTAITRKHLMANLIYQVKMVKSSKSIINLRYNNSETLITILERKRENSKLDKT